MARSVMEIMKTHTENLLAGNLEETLADYAPDAFMIMPQKIVRGHDELRAHFENSLKNTITPDTVSEMIDMRAEGNIGYVVWKAENSKLVFSYATDTFVIENDKIIAQTFAAVVKPKK